MSLAEGSVPLARFLAGKYGRRALDPEGVLGTAFLALLKAEEGFDPERGPWGAWASSLVGKAVRGEVLRQFREPRPEPLYAVSSEGEEIERSDLPHEEPHDGAGLMALRLREALANLEDRERSVLVRRFGLEGQEETLEEVGRAVGLSRARVAQLERRALRQLRRALTRRRAA